MSSILGSAPILDFDGTLGELEVDWRDLRQRLGVASVDELWERHDDRAWADVAAAEQRAASHSPIHHAMAALLQRVDALAILTDNSEAAVWAFVKRHDGVLPHPSVVVGRETLRGSKRDWLKFRRGFTLCERAIEQSRGEQATVYVGDQEYELSYARRLGAVALSTAKLLNGGLQQ
jgi:phosphoglycolate phosphatase-like HAD superfamily hydrolase